MSRPAQAIILAAGRGSRLSPYTDESPKCLLSFAGRRLLDWQLAALRANGVHDVGIVCGYRAHSFDSMGLKRWDNPRWHETNMVYSLLCAREALESCDGMVVSYGDIVYEPRVVATLLDTPGDMVTVVDRRWLSLWKLRFADPLKEAESLKMDDARQVHEIGRPAASLEEIEGQYIGLLRFSRKGLDALLGFLDRADPHAAWLMGRSLETCYMTDMLRGLIQAGHAITGAEIDGGWLEFDSVSDYDLYARLSRERRLEHFAPAGEGR